MCSSHHLERTPSISSVSAWLIPSLKSYLQECPLCLAVILSKPAPLLSQSLYDMTPSHALLLHRSYHILTWGVFKSCLSAVSSSRIPASCLQSLHPFWFLFQPETYEGIVNLQQLFAGWTKEWKDTPSRPSYWTNNLSQKTISILEIPRICVCLEFNKYLLKN